MARRLHDSNRLVEAAPLLRRAVVIPQNSFQLGPTVVATVLENLTAVL